MAKENATTRSPIKIACYTTSTEKTKSVQLSSQRKTTKNTTSSTLKLTLSLTPLVNLSNDNASLEDYITVCVKLKDLSFTGYP